MSTVLNVFYLNTIHLYCGVVRISPGEGRHKIKQRNVYNLFNHQRNIKIIYYSEKMKISGIKQKSSKIIICTHNSYFKIR